jgi:hypothetical protein
MGLTDYPFIIKNPMDLSTLGNNLRDEKYRYVEEFLDDTQLVWDNCKAYNAPGTVSLFIKISGSSTLQKTCNEPSRKWLRIISQTSPSPYQEVVLPP